MMKKIISLILSLVMVMCLSVPAFAEGDTRSFSVTYNVESSYVINLPDITLTADTNTFTITADYVHIAPNKRLFVNVDKSTSFTDNTFYLYKSGSTDINAAIPCAITVETVNKQNSNLYSSYALTSSGVDCTVAQFLPEITTPEAFGRLIFTPQPGVNNSYGSYAGTIYYTIEIK